MTRQSYATEIRIIRLMCTGRVDLAFVLHAFQKGADGVIVGGCWPGECNYVTEGNYDALANTYVLKRLLGRIGVCPGRVRLEWMSAAEGARFAEVMSDFADRLRELGPLGEGEGLSGESLRVGLEALRRLVPWLKLVEREKLRVPERTVEAYRAFFEGEAADRVFSGLIAEKVDESRILLLLEEEPLSTREIAERLSLTPAEVAKHMRNASRQALVRYDRRRNRYAPAGAGQAAP